MVLRDPTHLFEGEVPERQLRFAKIVSDILQPTLVSIPVFLILCILTEDAAQYAVCASISIFFAVIFPIIEIALWARHKGTDGDIPNKEDRFFPLLMGASSYTIGAFLLWAVNAPAIITALMTAYAINTFAIMLISPHWKISIHATGVVGPTMALVYAFGPIGIILIFTLPLIMWSRYVLKRHTPAQLVCGALMGFALTSIIFAIML